MKQGDVIDIELRVESTEWGEPIMYISILSVRCVIRVMLVQQCMIHQLNILTIHLIAVNAIVNLSY
jgi:hypothetical protein